MGYAAMFMLAVIGATLARAAPASRAGIGLSLACALAVLLGMRGDSVDHHGYEAMFELMDRLELPRPEQWFLAKDFLFGALIDGVQQLGGRLQAVFLAAAVLAVAIKQHAFAQVLGKDTALAWLVTLCLSFFLHEFTQIRTAIALPLCFLALIRLNQGRVGAWIGLTLLATGFHASALVFIPVASVLLLRPSARLGGWLAMTLCLTAAIPIARELVGTIDPRLEAHGDIVGFNLTAIGAGILKLALLLPIAFASKRLAPHWDSLRALVWPSVMFIATGLLLLVLLRNYGAATAFRLYEFFDAFAVWVLLAAFYQPRPGPKLLAAVYCAFALLLQYLPGLFTPYVFVSPWQLWGA